MSYDAYTKPDTRRRKSWIVCTVPRLVMHLVLTRSYHQAFSVFIVLLIIAAIVGVAVGVPLSRKNDKKNLSANSDAGSNGDSKGNGNSGGNNNKPPNTNTGPDPSIFSKDPNLHQAFYGIAYTPDGSQLPNCGNSLG